MLIELFVGNNHKQRLFEITLPASERIYGNPHSVVLREEIVEWLNTHVGPQSFDYNRMFSSDADKAWCVNTGTRYAFFQFRDKQTAMIFKLTWG
jgi:hypothetical protein